MIKMPLHHAKACVCEKGRDEVAFIGQKRWAYYEAGVSVQQLIARVAVHRLALCQVPMKLQSESTLC